MEDPTSHLPPQPIDARLPRLLLPHRRLLLCGAEKLDALTLKSEALGFLGRVQLQPARLTHLG